MQHFKTTSWLSLLQSIVVSALLGTSAVLAVREYGRYCGHEAEARGEIMKAEWVQRANTGRLERLQRRPSR